MRILHLADRWTDRGGSYWHLAGILEHQKAEHAVFLGAGRDDGTMRGPVAPAIVPGLDARLRQQVFLQPLLRELRPDVLHLHNVVNPELLEKAGKLESVTTVVTVQDHRFFCPARGKWTEKNAVCEDRMSRDTCRDCFSDRNYFHQVYPLTAERLEALSRCRTIVLSRYMKRELVEAGLDESRISVVPPFVHGLDRDAGVDGPPSVLFAGRLVESKGARDAVIAWRRSGVTLPLVIAGTGPLREELESSGAEVLGWVPHANMASLYRRAAAVLMPSRWQEPFGIAGLEALTMGTPVVAWESGGIAEWHPGPLAAWGDVDAMGALLCRAPLAAEAPAGFDAGTLMRRLAAVYHGE